MSILLGMAVVAVLLVSAFAAMFNRLTTTRNRYKNAYAQIDVQLKRRYDLIPRLAETARGYLKHERETIEAIVAARGAAAAANGRAAAAPGEAAVMAEVAGAETALFGALARFRGVVERYPDLKADASMGRLMEELASTENRVAFARQCFNDAVMVYNTARETFPHLLIAQGFGFGPAAYFRIDEAQEREAVKVSLGPA